MRHVFASFSLMVVLSAGFAYSQTLEWLNSANVPVPNRILAAPDDNVLTPLKGNVYGLARAEFDRGVVNDSLELDRMILLLQRSPEQEQTLAAVIDGQKNRKSPLYHHWVTAPQFGRHFGPSDQDLAVVVSWLQTHGFHVDQVTPGRTAIIFSGTAGEVRAAFHAEIHNLEVNGRRHIANLAEPQIPTALAPVIKGFRSLNDFRPQPSMERAGTFQRDPLTGRWHPQAGTMKTPAPDITVGVDEFYLVGPQDFYVIYNENSLLTSGINGAGATIAVVEETDINPADVTTFRSQFVLPTYPTPPNNTGGGVNYLFGANGFCTDPGILTDGEESEADIDTEWAGTSAPNAIIDFVSCATTSTSPGIDLSAMYIVNDLAPQATGGGVAAFSLSYGACEYLAGSSAGAFYTDLWQQAAAQGQTAIISSGDSGSMGCDQGSTEATNPLSVNVIASTGYNVAAGGTDFSDSYQTEFFSISPNIWWNTTPSTQTNGYESALSYIPEKAWGGYCSDPLTGSYLQAVGVGATYGVNPFQVCNNANSQGLGYLAVVGGGGGVSSFNAIPTWQAVYGVGLTGNYTSGIFRNLPDISLFAANGFWGHALVFCESDLGVPCDYTGLDALNLAAGGTSFVAPEIAGIMALVVQQTQANQGPANYDFYGLAAQEYGVATGTFNGANCSGSGLGAGVGATCLFQDIAGDTPCLAGGTTDCNPGATTITSNIEQPCEWSATYANCFHRRAAQTVGISSISHTAYEAAYPTGQGYDAATGLGSVNIANLVTGWNTLTTLFPTTTTLDANPALLTTLESVALTATVTATGRGGMVAPLGNVTFTDYTSGATLGTAMLAPTCNSAVPPVCTGPSTAMLTVQGTALALGANSLIASFSGDAANDAPSASAPVNVAVELAPSTVTLTVSPNPATVGQTITFTATVAGTSGSPTGTVTFLNGTTPLGPPVAVSGGTAVFTTNSLAAGSYSITADYSGDSVFAPSVSSSVALVVTLAPSSISLSASSTTPLVCQSVTFTATVTGTAGTPTGTVTFLDGTAVLGTVTLSSGSASFTASGLAVGVHAISAQYSGDSMFAAGTSATVAITVSLSPSTTTLTASATSAPPGQALTFTATVTGMCGTPTGTVTFLNGSLALATVPLSGGSASFTTSSLGVGANAIVAQYSGDSMNAPSSSAVTAITIQPPPTPVLVVTPPSAPLSIKAGQSQTATVSVDTTPSGQNVGTVTLTCSVAPQFPNGPTCTLSPGSVSTLPATVMVTVTTTDQDARLHGIRRLGGSALATLALLLPGLLLVPAGTRQGRRRVLWLLCGMLLMMSFAVMGCGSGRSAPYTVTVSANAPSAVSDSVGFAVDVHN